MLHLANEIVFRNTDNVIIARCPRAREINYRIWETRKIFVIHCKATAIDTRYLQEVSSQRVLFYKKIPA